MTKDQPETGKPSEWADVVRVEPVSSAKPTKDQTDSDGPDPDSQPDAQPAGTPDSQDNAQDSEQESGNVTAEPDASDPAPDKATRARELVSAVTGRLMREKRWHHDGIAAERDDMMKLCKERFPDKADRQLWVYAELDRMYPPKDDQGTPMAHSDDLPRSRESTPLAYSTGVEDGQIQGLSDIPSDWPELPANAPLGAEVGWVQANRLRVVEERPGKATLIRLSQALSPAPSWAALGWLETSVRSYAKFVDVAAKAASTDDGESSVVRRERMAIEEMEGLLDEMMEAEPDVCPRCGRSKD